MKKGKVFWFEKQNKESAKELNVTRGGGRCRCGASLEFPDRKRREDLKKRGSLSKEQKEHGEERSKFGSDSLV